MWVPLGWEAKGLACLGGAGAGFLVPSEGNDHIITTLAILDRRHSDRRPLTSANHVWTSSSGSTLGMGGSHCQKGQTIPLGRGGGHELPSWAVEIKNLSLICHRVLFIARKCSIGE